MPKQPIAMEPIKASEAAATLCTSFHAGLAAQARKQLLAVHDYLLKTISVLHAETVELSGNKRS